MLGLVVENNYKHTKGQMLGFISLHTQPIF